MNSQTKILEERLFEIRETLLELEYLKKDVKTLIFSEEEHRHETIPESHFFVRLYHNYLRLFVIDVYKLIGNKEDHNIHKLIEFCKINLKVIKWHDSISIEKLKLLNDKLYSISVKFEQIQGLRNKYFAHNDKKKRQFSFKISLEELWEVLEGLQSIFAEINLHFDNNHWLFDIQYTSPGIIQSLSKYKRLRKLTLEEYGKNKPSIETNRLLSIIRSR